MLPLLACVDLEEVTFVAEEPDRFRLPEGGEPLWVAGERVRADHADGWTWDAPLRTVALHGDAVPAAGDVVTVWCAREEQQ